MEKQKLTDVIEEFIEENSYKLYEDALKMSLINNYKNKTGIDNLNKRVNEIEERFKTCNTTENNDSIDKKIFSSDSIISNEYSTNIKGQLTNNRNLLVINKIINKIINNIYKLEEIEDLCDQVNILSTVIDDINNLLQKYLKTETNKYKRAICLHAKTVIKYNYCEDIFNNSQIESFIFCFKQLLNTNVDKEQFLQVDREFYKCRLV